jgi:tetratricopeptide (TPR) repeat protein
MIKAKIQNPKSKIDMSRSAILPAFSLILLVLGGTFISTPATAQLFEDPLFAPLNNGTQGEIREEADRLVRFGGQAERQGQYQKAIDYWLQAADIYQQLGELQALGLTYDYLGITYLKIDRLDAAENYLRRRLAIARDRKDIRGQIYGYNNVGTVLLQYGNYEGAEAAFQEALILAQSVKSDEGQGLSISNLGLLAAMQGNYEAAIKHYEAAIIFRRRASDPIGEINTRNSLGDAYLALRNYDEAQISYGIARQLAREGQDVAGQFRAMRGLARTYIVAGNSNAALTELKKWTALARENQNLRQELAALRLTGQVYQSLEDWARAQQFFADALAIASAIEDVQQEALLRNELVRAIYLLP